LDLRRPFPQRGVVRHRLKVHPAELAQHQAIGHLELGVFIT